MRRVLGLFALSALLPLTLAGAAVGALSFSGQREGVARQAKGIAQFSSTLVGRELKAGKRSMQMIAQSPAFDAAFDQARFDILSRRLLADEPFWRAISVADPRGNRMFDIPRPIAGRPGGRVVDPDSLFEAVRTGRPVAGNVIVGPKGNAAFALRAPAMRSGAARFVVSAVVSPAALTRLLPPESIPAGWQVRIIDGTGKVVAASGAAGGVDPDLSALRPDRLTAAGGGRIGLVSAVPESNWRVVVTAPGDAYAAPARAAMLIVGACLLASLLMALAVARLLWGELAQQRRQELAVLETQRLEALGRMTGGVAHDFNNLLTPILGGLDLLQRRLPADPRTSRLLEGAVTSAERAKALVLRLLAFARRQALMPQDFDVAALLTSLTDLLEGAVGSNVRVTLQLEDDALFAKADPAQLELAVLNLAINARDAMPDGGAITIAAEEVVTRTRDALAAGRYVRITVADTGVGMDAATLKRAIEPFFTTKDLGRGTGLGLSMVHGMAAQSGGALILSSKPGEGTRAEIWLPVGAPQASAPQSNLPPSENVGRILLVDDDDLVRSATAEVLSDHGHEVIEAASAAEGLRHLAAMPDIELIVTDYAMPGRSGADLAREARQMRPTIPILMITGYAPTIVGLPDDVPRLGKPFRRLELLRRIGELLATGTAPAAAETA